MIFKIFETTPTIYMLQHFPELREKNVHYVYSFDIYNQYYQYYSITFAAVKYLQIKLRVLVKTLEKQFNAIEYNNVIYFTSKEDINNAIEWMESVIIMNKLAEE